MNYWIHPDAEGELEDAAVFYAENVSRTLANAFLAEYERVVELLVENQRRGPHGDYGMRVYDLNVFLYTDIYEEDLTAGPQIYVRCCAASKGSGLLEVETPSALQSLLVRQPFVRVDPIRQGNLAAPRRITPALVGQVAVPPRSAQLKC